jgi:2-C-methyl-D-erythritol 4-phosphate cytidylyltransferase/2-C-methyl-D-erythritol 2,4-cyclodiphosphate synthase
MDRPSVVVVLVGAGAGRRLGDEQPKAFRRIGGRPILAAAASAAASVVGVRRLVAVVPPGAETDARSALEDVPVPVDIVPGGATRQDSVRAGLAVVEDAEGIVLVHDAARPFASIALFARVIEAIEGPVVAAVPVVPVTDTVVRVGDGALVGVESRDELALAQTPQGFRIGVLRDAHAKAEGTGTSFTDDATLVRWAGFEVRTVDGELGNRKITTSADLADAEQRAGGTGA